MNGDDICNKLESMKCWFSILHTNYINKVPFKKRTVHLENKFKILTQNSFVYIV